MIQIDFVYGDEVSLDVALSVSLPQVPTIGDVVFIEDDGLVVTAVHWFPKQDGTVSAVVYLEDRDQ